MSKTMILFSMIVAAGIYSVWAICHLDTLNKRHKKTNTRSGNRKVREVIGKGKFVLPPACRLKPQAAEEPQSESTEENPNIFAPGNVPEHPKQIPPEELDAAFGEAPEGVANEPLKYHAPLFVSSDFPDYDDAEPDLEENPEDDFGHLPHCATSHAQDQTLSFEQLGEVYRHVVHSNPLTDEQKQVTGQILLGVKGTEFYRFLENGQPEGEDRVKACLDAALGAFEVANTDRDADYAINVAPAPEGFEVQIYEPTDTL